LLFLLGCDTSTTHGDPIGTPVAVIEATPVSGVAPLTIQFNGESSHWDRGIGTTSFYTWSFGDGDSAEAPMVQHTYLQPGSNEACLTFGAVGSETLTDKACVTVSAQ
jgi:PKD repeat protein